MRRRWPLLLLALLLVGSRASEARTIPLRVDFPDGTPKTLAVPVTGGIPFPRGALADAAGIRVLKGREEIPSQVLRTAVWPDGSVKWALVDLVLAPADAKGLRLEFGSEVRRAKVRDPVKVQDPGWRLALSTVRDGRLAKGRVVIEERTVEVAGPIRARVLVRGHFRVPGYGTGLPDRVKKSEPAERVPFTLRTSFFRGCPVVVGDHRIVFTGEPDHDFITRWGLDLPKAGAGGLRVVREPGRDEDRLCWAPTKGGLVLIRQGWENRPVAVGGEKGGDARIDFWPAEAGPWDLRRYAREWGVGESGNRESAADIERYAKYAARGLAKSHTFVVWRGEGGVDTARALSGRAMLVAPPGWYAGSGALGLYAPTGPWDDGVRRTLDWFLFHQDLYRWHGKVDYGFWQTRNGDIHRHDRWDRDYGRWGWSLNDGAGRIGHVLMLEYLRTLERRYLTAGDAFNRAVFDTAMVNTELHLENARPNWWRAKGLTHRHGVQPFSGPYIGMRGSNPGGARILHHLTGDGVLGDGLRTVAQVAFEFATSRPGAFGASGGPDGQGSGAMALLFAHESTGDAKYLEACRAILDKSSLFPPEDPKRLGYGPGFGLYLAAAEYLFLTNDPEFETGFLRTADLAAASKDPMPYLPVLAEALRRTGKASYRSALERAIAAFDATGSLAELPPERWPGHGGARRAPRGINEARDLPYARAPLVEVPVPGPWPKARPFPASLPAEVPADWPRPAGAATGRPPDPKKLLARRATMGGAPVRSFVLVAGKPGRAKHVVHGKAGRRGGPLRLEIAVDPGREPVDAFGVAIPLTLSDNPAAHHVTVPARFRTERWRVDQNDEAIPSWLNSDRRTRWPVWRRGGVLLGPGGAYRIFKRNRADTSRLFVDQGFGSPGWLDVTDRGGAKHTGTSVRLLRDPDQRASIVFDAERSEIRVALLDVRAPAAAVVEVQPHDGWRSPFSDPKLTRKQYLAMLDDLDYGENIGLTALRFLLAETHKVGPGDWKTRIADRGITARQILLGMEWKGALERHCRRIGVKYDGRSSERSIARIVEHYGRR